MNSGPGGVDWFTHRRSQAGGGAEGFPGAISNGDPAQQNR